jgi:molybdate-binding protein
MLIDHLMFEHSIVPTALSGYLGRSEHTHVAVASCVASGTADAGIGVEAAALEFGLHFTPLAEETYFLACLKANMGDAAVQRLCTVLAGQGWRDILAALPGYQPSAAAGEVLVIDEALPWWRRVRTRRRDLVAG